MSDPLPQGSPERSVTPAATSLDQITTQHGVALRIRRLALDTGRENVAVLLAGSTALRPEVFRSFSRVAITAAARTIIATLMTSDDPMLIGPAELGLAEPAFHRLGGEEGDSVTLLPIAPPDSLDAVRRKIAGSTLPAADIEAIVRDISTYRYADIEIAAFLVGAASFMSTDELLALTRALADIGGIPGNRTSMIVVPIVAAHGLLMPETSSRAITSPAGTADTMEVLARVDLDVDDMRRVVETCGGCVVWGGHVGLSPADDVLISVERPLGIDNRELMVASILSKKLAAGSTRLLIDIPVGPRAKVHDADEAMRLRKLFEFLGDRLGLPADVILTDGRQPIGRGIGPVLEAQDVMQVLSSDPAAPSDLREKAIRVASHILEYDPGLRGGAGYARAVELLDTGAAMVAMQRIIDAQGPPPARPALGHMTAEVVAEQDGTVASIDNLRLNRLARLAGAPIAKGAGISIHKKIGDHVGRGEPLYRIYASEPFEFDFALTAARHQHGYQLTERI